MEQHFPTAKGLQMIVVYAVMAVFATIAFGLRAYVRVRLVQRSWEDWAAGIGWFVYILFCGSSMVGPFYGLGQHEELIPPGDVPIALRQWYIGELTYVAANLAVKLSIALMLLRFAMEEYQKRLIYIVTGVTQVYSLVFFFVFACQCTPGSFFWTRFQGATDGRCINPKITVITGYIYLGVTILYDWTMAILPWLIVRKMQLDLRTRRMIAVVLALGSIASIATLIRIPYVATLGKTKDFLYDNVNLAIWAGIETGLSIIASSVATLKPLFRRSSSQYRPSGRLTPKLNTIVTTTDNSDFSTITKSSDVEVAEMTGHRFQSQQRDAELSGGPRSWVSPW